MLPIRMYKATVDNDIHFISWIRKARPKLNIRSIAAMPKPVPKMKLNRGASPMLIVQQREAFDDPEWIYDLKLDGFWMRNGGGKL